MDEKIAANYDYVILCHSKRTGIIENHSTLSILKSVCLKAGLGRCRGLAVKMSQLSHS